MFNEPMWDAVTSWFTPTTLFLLLNFMIATIFLTSGLSSSSKPLTKSDHHEISQTHHSQSQHQHTEQPIILLQRSPSVLQRLKSINFYQYTTSFTSHPTHTASFDSDNHSSSSEQTHTASFHANDYHNNDDDEFEAEEDRFDEEADRTIEEVFSDLRVEKKRSDVVRTKSETEPASGAVPVKLVKKMKKSASSKSAFRHFSEAEVLEARRPATAREVKTVVEGGEDEEVDMKADDFINKFKQQLKLQRLDSILRYKEMLGRGAGK